MRIPVIRAVLFDLDGVIRHFDPNHVAGIERDHALPPGSIEAYAFSSPIIEEVTTGRITRSAWVSAIGQHVGSAAAAVAWGRQPFTADMAAFELLDELRAVGYRTAVLTNGTDGIPDEVAAIGLPDRVDAIFSSHEIGFTKPDRRSFQYVLDVLGLTGPEVFFTDDSKQKLSGATELGMTVHHFTGISPLRRALSANGVRIT